jgi:hypothetical protein
MKMDVLKQLDPSEADLDSDIPEYLEEQEELDWQRGYVPLYGSYRTWNS